MNAEHDESKDEMNQNKQGSQIEDETNSTKSIFTNELIVWIECRTCGSEVSYACIG